MSAPVAQESLTSPVVVVNANGSSALVLVCEHASNFVPPRFEKLGLSAADLRRHIAWDIGALALAEQLSARLDAALVYATHSRLLLDLNRDPSEDDSIVEVSEDTRIPGNANLTKTERQRRRVWLYQPFHQAISALLDVRARAHRPTALLSVHSFTPVYHGKQRIWDAGVVSNRDRRLADPMLLGLRRNLDLCVGDNEPYSGIVKVYHTMNRHAEANGLPSVLLEVRNDLISTAAGRMQWTQRLASVLNPEMLSGATRYVG